MKSLLLCILIFITAGNLVGQSEKPKEKVAEAPPPVLIEVEEVWPVEYEGVDESLMEAPPPPELEELNSEEPFSYVEQMPSFPEGTEAMYKFIYSNLTYPELAKQNAIAGQVIIQFVVSGDGTITNAKVVRGLGGGCNEEALRVVNAMPKWIPGIHNGRAVPVTFTLPIKFAKQ